MGCVEGLGDGVQVPNKSGAVFDLLNLFTVISIQSVTSIT
jgi:hypothetical protein